MWSVISSKTLAIAVTIFAGLASSAPAFDVIGHRGARGLAPENTLAGFIQGARVGATVVEADVTLTRDEQVIVRHDARVSHTVCRGPNQGRLYRWLTLAQVKRLDCGTRRAHDGLARTQTAVPGAHVPTLDQVYRAVPPGVRLLVEPKTDPTHPRETFPASRVARRVVAVIRAAHGLRRTTVQSFDWRVLRDVGRLAPGLRLQALASEHNAYPDSPWLAGFVVGDRPFDGAVVDTVRRAGFNALAVPARLATQPLVDLAHDRRLALLAYTVDRPETMLALIRLGLDGLVSDYPDRLAAEYRAR